MTPQEKTQRLTELKALIEQAMSQAIAKQVDGASMQRIDSRISLQEWEKRWVASLHGEAKVPHYIIRELVKYLEERIAKHQQPLRW
jgi:hypothetical protein